MPGKRPPFRSRPPRSVCPECRPCRPAPALSSRRFPPQALIDTRSLDLISRNMTRTHLFTAADAPFLMQRIDQYGLEVKVRRYDT